MNAADLPELPRTVRVGDVAPDFIARSTKGEVRLSSYRGRWVIFFSHPADFTPVCTTEFVALAKHQAEFDALDCALLGLSVDSLYAHIAWVRATEELFGVAIEFPIIEDPGMAVGYAYGMIDNASTDARSMRSTYFIDPKGVVRAVTTYPHDVGRSVDEMLRLLSALQAVDDGQGFAPEGWQPGTSLLTPPADGAAPREQAADWFCQTLS